MRLPFGAPAGAHARRALGAELRARLERLDARAARDARLARERLAEPLGLARLCVVDLETTGPDLRRDRIVALGAVAVCAGTLRHADCLERVLRQPRPSAAENILVHRIGGQQQLAGGEPALALLELLEFVGPSLAVAFRAEFDATVLGRELRRLLGGAPRPRFVDLAVVLPALWPGTPNDTLDDWVRHLGVPAPARHAAAADAYASAQLLLCALERARAAGLQRVGDLLALEHAQRWLGRRR